MENAPVYPDNLVLKDALRLYFDKYHFENGGYDLKWFRIKLGPVYIPLPNTKGRVAAVKLHDIHHIITEYPATLKGEAEIGAWEIASGCGKYYAAWILNIGSFFYGLFFFLPSIWRAFLNGRAIKTNCYHDTAYNDALLNKTVGELRRETLSTGKPKPSDYLAFIFFSLVSIVWYLAFIIGGIVIWIGVKKYFNW